MHTKPISTKVIASYEATLTSGFAKLILNDGKLEFNGISATAPNSVQEFCQAMIKALNGDPKVAGCWQDIFQIFRKIKEPSEESRRVRESLKAEKNLSMAFQATVIYPFVLEKFFFSDDAKEFLQRQIEFDGPTDDEKRKLADYYNAVDKRMETISQQNNGLDVTMLSAESNGIDMMGYVNAFEALRCGTFRAKVENISNFPSGLLPLSSPSSSSPSPVDATASSANATPNPTPNRFQEAWKKIAREEKTYPFAHQYKMMQMDLLPVIYIIANMEVPKDGGQDMGETVVTSLFDDLSAAKLFYSMLSESEDAGDRSRSTTVTKDIAAILSTLKCTSREKGPPEADDNLKKRPIFQFLRHNHHISHEYKALVHYSKLRKSPQKGANRVDVLAWFCNKFQVDYRSPIVQ